MKHTTYILLSLLSITVLTACGPEDDDTASIAGGGRGGDSVGFLTLSITDAPVDIADLVLVQIDGVTLQHEAESGPTVITYPSPKLIDLLTLQGQVSASLLENEALKSGNYNWIRLNITASDDGVLDSYIRLKTTGEVFELDIPSGNQNGLKINKPLFVTANALTTVTIDVDLTRSIVLDSGDYKLKPVLDLVHDELVGMITVQVENFDACIGPIGNNKVYLYEGNNVTPDDYGSAGEPIANAIPEQNSAGDFEVEFGFVPFGKYTVALACQAVTDDSTTDDDALVFGKKTKNVPVTNSNPRFAEVR